MKVTKAKVSLGVTRNMGNYESLRIDEGLEVELEEGEDWKQVIDSVRHALQKKLDQDILAEIEWMNTGG